MSCVFQLLGFCAAGPHWGASPLHFYTRNFLGFLHLGVFSAPLSPHCGPLPSAGIRQPLLPSANSIDSIASVKASFPAGQVEPTWQGFPYKGMEPFHLFLRQRLCSALTSLFFGSFSLVRTTTREARSFNSFFQASGRRRQDPTN